MKNHPSRFDRFDHDIVSRAGLRSSARLMPARHEDPDPDWQPV